MLNVQITACPMPRIIAYTEPSCRQKYQNSDWSNLQEVAKLLHFEHAAPEFDERSTLRRRRVRAGKTVYGKGQAYVGLYVVRTGALKTVVLDCDGGERILSFSMKGGVLGADGFCSNAYQSEAVAISDCEVILLPAHEVFTTNSASCNDVTRLAYWAISQEIVKEQAALAMYQATRSKFRVAQFLLVQSACFSAMGYASTCFVLPMTRSDIGNHLGITTETVSRALFDLQRMGIIDVVHREITIHCSDALRAYKG